MGRSTVRGEQTLSAVIAMAFGMVRPASRARPFCRSRFGAALVAVVVAAGAPAAWAQVVSSDNVEIGDIEIDDIGLEDVARSVELDGPVAPSASGARLRCDAPYVIGAGESLTIIAQRVLRDGRRWNEIYAYRDNRRAIGPNPNTLVNGTRIDIPPCEPGAWAELVVAQPDLPAPGADVAAELPDQARLDGDAAVAQVAVASASTLRAPRPSQRQGRPSGAPASSAEAEVRQLTASAATVTAPEPFLQEIDVLTGGDYLPLADKNAPGGGMATQIVEAAFAASSLENPIQIDFVNDWSAHLRILLRGSKYPFGFPWPKPNCSDLGSASEERRLRCEYVYSDPIYVVAIDTFGASGLGEAPSSYEDLRSKRICRPRGWVLDDLEEHGLTAEGAITLVRSATVVGCFELLERGEVDYVSMSRFPAERAIADLGLSEFVMSYPALSSAQTVHLASHRDNAEASILWMRAFNQGLDAIKRSGQLDEIVDWHLDSFRKSL